MLRLRLPLVMFNTGGRATVVVDLRCWFPRETRQVLSLPWRRQCATLESGPDQEELPVPFPVQGRSGLSLFAEFGGPFPGLGAPSRRCPRGSGRVPPNRSSGLDTAGVLFVEGSGHGRPESSSDLSTSRWRPGDRSTSRGCSTGCARGTESTGKQASTSHLKASHATVSQTAGRVGRFCTSEREEELLQTLQFARRRRMPTMFTAAMTTNPMASRIVPGTPSPSLPLNPKYSPAPAVSPRPSSEQGTVRRWRGDDHLQGES